MLSTYWDSDGRHMQCGQWRQGSLSLSHLLLPLSLPLSPPPSPLPLGIIRRSGSLNLQLPLQLVNTDLQRVLILQERGTGERRGGGEVS